MTTKYVSFIKYMTVKLSSISARLLVSINMTYMVKLAHYENNIYIKSKHQNDKQI